MLSGTGNFLRKERQHFSCSFSTFVQFFKGRVGCTKDHHLASIFVHLDIRKNNAQGRKHSMKLNNQKAANL